MEEKITYIIIALVVIAIILLLRWYIKWKAYGQAESKAKKQDARRKEAALKGLLVNCPLCRTPLLPGEDLISRVYRPMTVSDQRCTINGCPHCYPNPKPGIQRICPVCSKEVPLAEGHYLIARLFNYPNGKKHVIVTGCTECCKK